MQITKQSQILVHQNKFYAAVKLIKHAKKAKTSKTYQRHSQNQLPILSGYQNVYSISNQYTNKYEQFQTCVTKYQDSAKMFFSTHNTKLTKGINQSIIIKQMQKNIILIVDNRAQDDNSFDPSKNLFRGSAFIATEVDPHEKNQASLDPEEEQSYLVQLQERIEALEKRVKQLERSSKQDKLKRRIRRKASQISRQYKCPHKDCQKFYGSQTSLKNHLKLKHSRRGQKNQVNDC